jgi:hypothetical protein
MRHTGFALLLVVGLVFGMPAVSSADGGGGGGFWEKMSGPGKWAYFQVYVRTCLDKPRPDEPRPDEDRELPDCILTNNRVWFNLGGSYAFAGAEDRVDLQSPALQQIALEPGLDFRVHNLSEAVPLLLGVGVGVHYFWGEDVSLTRYSIEPRVSIIFPNEPFSSWNLGLRYAVKVFPQGFTAEDFGDPTGTFTSNGTDVVNTLSVFFSF